MSTQIVQPGSRSRVSRGSPYLTVTCLRSQLHRPKENRSHKPETHSPPGINPQGRVREGPRMGGSGESWQAVFATTGSRTIPILSCVNSTRANFDDRPSFEKKSSGNKPYIDLHLGIYPQGLLHESSGRDRANEFSRRITSAGELPQQQRGHEPPRNQPCSSMRVGEKRTDRSSPHRQCLPF